MGSFVRQRLIAHSFRGEPCFRVLGVAPQGYGNGSSAAGYATESGQDEASSTWFQRLKGVLKGKESSETKPQGSELVASDPKATLPGDFTLENFTDELKKARQFGSVTTVGRGLPRGGEMSAVMSSQRHEDILRALYKRDPVRVGAQQKYFWQALRGCQGYSSLPPRDEGEAGEGIQDEVGGEGVSKVYRDSCSNGIRLQVELPPAGWNYLMVFNSSKHQINLEMLTDISVLTHCSKLRHLSWQRFQQ